MLWRCATCGTPTLPGCPDTPGADGFITAETLDDGAVRTVAYHFRSACSGRQRHQRSTPRQRAQVIPFPVRSLQATELRQGASHVA